MHRHVLLPLIAAAIPVLLAAQSAQHPPCRSGGAVLPCRAGLNDDGLAAARANARGLELHGNSEDALRAYQDAARRYPVVSALYLEIARLSDALGRRADALAAYQRFVQLEPHESRGHELLAWAYVEIGNPELALHAFRRAAEADSTPGRASVASGTGMMLAALGRHEEALRSFAEAARLDPSDAAAWGLMATSAEALKRRREAVGYWERALRVAPGYFDARPQERKEWEAAIRSEGPQPPADVPEPGPQQARATASASRDSASRPPLLGNGPTSSGSGFYVDRSGAVLTNKHVVRGCSVLRARGDSGLTVVANVIATDSADDLALLRAAGAPTHVAAFRDGAAARPGDDVVAVGFPLSGLLADEVNISTGSINALGGLYNDDHALQMSAPVQPGSSGGPLFDASGNVVGVVVTKLNARVVGEAMGDIPQNVNFAIKARIARAFLDAHDVRYELAQSTTTRSHADIGEIGRRVTVMVQCWR